MFLSYTSHPIYFTAILFLEPCLIPDAPALKRFSAKESY